MSIKTTRALWLLQAGSGIIVMIGLLLLGAISHITGEWSDALVFLTLFILWVRAGLHKPDSKYPAG